MWDTRGIGGERWNQWKIRFGTDKVDLQYPKEGRVFKDMDYKTEKCKTHLIESTTDTSRGTENTVDLTEENFKVGATNNCKTYFSTVACNIEVPSGKNLNTIAKSPYS